jgi:hypothetical protein
VCVGGLTTRAEREHTAVAYNCIVGGALTPTAIDVYVFSLLTTAERVMVDLLPGRCERCWSPGTTDAQHSTCRVPPCHQCVTEQTSTTHRLEGPFQHQPSQRPHAALCCMRQHSTHPSTSTVISALCLRQRSAAAPTPAPHRVLSATPRLSQSINTHTVHQYTTTCGSRSGGLRRFPPNQGHRPLFHPLPSSSRPQASAEEAMALSALSAKPCAASAPSSKVRAPAPASVRRAVKEGGRDQSCV